MFIISSPRAMTACTQRRSIKKISSIAVPHLSKYFYFAVGNTALKIL